MAEIKLGAHVGRLGVTPFAHLPGGALGSEPIDEPDVSYGPFVMNTEDDIRQAIDDYRSGRMGHIGS